MTRHVTGAKGNGTNINYTLAEC